MVTNEYEQAPDAAGLHERERAALALTDCIVSSPKGVPAELQIQLDLHFTEAEQAELVLGVGLFLGMSKVLITLGLEPEEMPVTVVATPGS